LAFANTIKKCSAFIRFENTPTSKFLILQIQIDTLL